jgi:hypothetical protein
VKYELTDLKYTGYDYYEDERRIGAYYYTIEDDQFLFVLVKTRNPESVIADKTIRGRLLSDSAHLEAMLDGFIDDTGLDKEALLPIIYPLMLSEVDYPIAETVLIWLLIILPYIVTTAVIILSVVWTIQPYKHPSAGKLSEFGERQLVYQEISSQLRREGVKCNYHYYFTADYLILSHWFTTDFIRVDYIRYISKHVIRTMGGRRQIYRLTMSNPKKMIFEKNFRKEACVDEIMEELIRRNPQIDNRTRHVFDLPEAEENQIEEPMLQHTGDEVEDVKIYKVKHRLRGTQEDAENMKIYKVKRRLRKKKDTSEDSD